MRRWQVLLAEGLGHARDARGVDLQRKDGRARVRVDGQVDGEPDDDVDALDSFVHDLGRPGGKPREQPRVAPGPARTLV